MEREAGTAANLEEPSRRTATSGAGGGGGKDDDTGDTAASGEIKTRGHLTEGV